MKAFRHKNHRPQKRTGTRKTTGRIRIVVALGLLWAIVSFAPSLFWQDALEVPSQKIAMSTVLKPIPVGSEGITINRAKDKSNEKNVAATAGPSEDLSTTPAAYLPLKDSDIDEFSDTELSIPVSDKIATEGAIATSEPDLTKADHAPNWLTFTVQKGDTLSGLFYKHGISATTLHQLVNSTPQAKKQLGSIKPGQSISIDVHDGELKQLRYKQSSLESLLFTRQSTDDFDFEQIVKKPAVQLVYANGTISDALFTAANKANIPDNITMELAGLFGWDIDFVQDIRTGDTFSLIYEEEFIEGQKIGYGKILVAEFVNRGKSYKALYYENSKGKAGYYTPEGKSLKKSFIRTPVEFTRISSPFAPNRLHPIYKTRRPHRAVDYAAPKGTPIKASGDGVIQFIGKQTGYGNVIYIKHFNNIVTVYAHQSRFARRLRKGQKVRQGQVIGYVGMTGWATGPHLHYEFRVNGKHRNPLKVKLPDAAPLPKGEMARFKKQSKLLLASLVQKKTTVLAATELYEQERSTN